MKAVERFVFDTNTLVSGALLRGSVPDQAVRLALLRGRLLMSVETQAELIRVLKREKFDTYVSLEERTRYIEALQYGIEFVDPVPRVIAARDPKDDPFLALASAGRADAIVTGDSDLLALAAFAGVPIITPAQFVERFSGAGV
jgi:putative PIN family toxin of toxin-antitoxin system